MLSTMNADPMLDTEEQHSRAAIARVGWTLPGGKSPVWPIRPRAVVDLLHAAGYEIDLDRIADFGRRRMIELPASGLWSAADTLALVGTLMSRRQLRFDGPQAPLLTPHLHALQHSRSVGRTAELLHDSRVGGPDHDVRTLLLLLAETDNREVREKLLALTLLTLEVEHTVVL